MGRCRKTAAPFYLQIKKRSGFSASLRCLFACNVVKIFLTRGDVAQFATGKLLQIGGIVRFLQRCLQRGVFLLLRGKLILNTGLLCLRDCDSVLYANKLNGDDRQQYDDYDRGERASALFLLFCHADAPLPLRYGDRPGGQTADTKLL